MAQLLLVAFESSDATQLAGFAQKLGLPFDVLLLTGNAVEPIGATKILTTNAGEIPPADATAKSIASVAGPYSHIAAVSSMQSKDVLARLAGILDAAMVTDAIQLESPTVFHRPIVAGSIIATVEVLAPQVVLTVRPSGFGEGESRPNGETQSISLDTQSKGERTARSARGGGRPDLSQANVVVSGGRPLRDAATFEQVIGGLADALGGAVGATRAAVDSGIAPNELQVGQTGKVVAPNLYIAAGISGSTQHMAGIKDSKTIVAINKDPDAPIFDFADLGLVADLYEAIPEFRKEIGK